MGCPVASNTCQTTEPPLPHVVPSVHATTYWPLPLSATDGCLRFLPSPGMDIGVARSSPLPVKSATRTCSLVSQAASTLSPPALVNDAVLITQTPISHGSTNTSVNVLPWSLEVSTW